MKTSWVAIVVLAMAGALAQGQSATLYSYTVPSGGVLGERRYRDTYDNIDR